MQGYVVEYGGFNAPCFMKKKWILMKLWPMKCLVAV